MTTTLPLGAWFSLTPVRSSRSTMYWMCLSMVSSSEAPAVGLGENDPVGHESVHVMLEEHRRRADRVIDRVEAAFDAGHVHCLVGAHEPEHVRGEVLVRVVAVALRRDSDHPTA